MQHLEKTVEIDAVVGFEGNAPFTTEKDVKFTTEDDQGYISVPRDILIDRATLNYLSVQLEIFQRQIDAGKES